MSNVQLIVGLGNPGQQYQRHRHNLGAIFVTQLAESFKVQFKLETKFSAFVAKILCNSRPIYLAIPSTYMNESGFAVSKLCQYYKLKPDQIIVAHDELDIPIGSIRVKQQGGHGGHNGIRHIQQLLGSKDFNRIRIGIGHPGIAKDVSKYVLSKPSTDEEITIFNKMDETIRLIPDILSALENTKL